MKIRVQKPLAVLAAAILGVMVFTVGCQQTPAASPTAAKPAAPAATTAPAQPAATAPTQVAAAPAPTQAPAPAKIDYPTRSIDFLVPFAAGGAADVGARRLAVMVEKDLGQPVVISNVTGAGGAVAYTDVKNSKQDGYKILWTSAAMATLPAQGSIDFNYSALDHLALVSAETVTLAVSADSQWKTLKDFLDESKKRGDAGKPMNVGNSGVGSFTHLSAVAIASKAGVPFTNIAFGAGLAVTNLIGGHIDASVQHPAEILSQYKGGSVRMLTVSSDKRIDAFKDVPTLKEQGIDLMLEQWRGISVAKGTPKPIEDKLEAAFLKAAKSSEWADFLATLGASPKPMTSAEMTKFVADQDVQIAALAKQVNADPAKK
jgi:tripartite-type tricarboxylate transporter receptor subunit TctC